MIEGYLAYFDILGFFEMLKTSDFSDKFTIYCKIIEDSMFKRDLEYKFFSDSAVLYTTYLTEASFFSLVQALSEIYYRLFLELDLVICGGISCGSFSFHRNNGNVIIAGIPMVDAVNLEQKQDWIGIMVSPKVINRVPIFKKIIATEFHASVVVPTREVIKPLAWFAYLQKTSDIPIKLDAGGIELTKGFVVLPIKPDLKNGEDVYNNLQDVNNKLHFMRYTASNTRVISKIERTKTLIVGSIRNWQMMKKVDLF